jgi:hypothetical protein
MTYAFPVSSSRARHLRTRLGTPAGLPVAHLKMLQHRAPAMNPDFVVIHLDVINYWAAPNPSELHELTAAMRSGHAVPIAFGSP